MGWRVLLMTIVIVAGAVAAVAQPVAADDMANKCDNAEVLEPGAHSGRLVNQDYDAFILDIDDGDYINANLSINPRRAQQIDFYGALGDDHQYADFSLNDVPENDAEDWVTTSRVNTEDGDVAFELAALESGTTCVRMRLQGADDQATDWRLAFTTEDAMPPPVADPERVEELQLRVEELEQQIESSDEAGEDISIDVTVQPGAENQAYVAGGEAVVQAEGQNVDWSEFRVGYQGESYSLDQSGTAAIPLTGAGEQQLRFSYADVTETAPITVQTNHNPDTTTDATTGEGTSETSEAIQGDEADSPAATEQDGAGFGSGMAIATLVVTALAVRRICGL